MDLTKGTAYNTEAHQMRYGPKKSGKANKSKKKSPEEMMANQIVTNSGPSTSDSAGIDTPCRQIAQLTLKPKVKSGKLLSSKSLSQLVPRNLFFKRNSSDKKSTSHHEQQTTTTRSSSTSYEAGQHMVQSSSGFSNGATIFQLDAMDLTLDQMSIANNMNRIHSASMIGLPRQSTCNTLNYHSGDNYTLARSNLSPIVATNNGMVMANDLRRNNETVCDTTSTPKQAKTKRSKAKKNKDDDQQSNDDKNCDDEKKCKDGMNKFKPFKNTALVLRDVKNSLGLVSYWNCSSGGFSQIENEPLVLIDNTPIDLQRIKAKQESKAFTKLTNEATPSTKLYSPFNIYTTPTSDTPKKEVKSTTATKSKAKRKLSLKKKQSPDETTTNPDDSVRTPKMRIALQHKKHLMQANKFAFDSPTGRLRETVKDVEQFQQCIEDISEAIRARGAGLRELKHKPQSHHS